MISSPPQEAEQIRAKSLSPVSPKPLLAPSPSNIPILEKQMDPMFNEPALSIGTPASFQSYPPPQPTPSAQSSHSYYGEQQGASNYQNAMANGAANVAPGDYAQSPAYSAGLGAHTQDTSINSFPSQNQPPPAAYSEPTSAPVQDNGSAYPSSYETHAYPAIPSQSQPPHGSPYQTQPSDGSGVNIQALLDNLSTPLGTANANDRILTPSSVPAPPSQIQGHAPTSSLPTAPNTNLPPRPDFTPVSHPNRNSNDDIRSYHPHSQKPQNPQYQRGSGQLQQLNTRGANGHSNDLRSAQSPSTPSYGQHGQRQSFDARSPDADEDIRWPPEVNKLYEEFLEEERRYVTDGQWDQFPYGSRLFIGNLPTEKVTKRDIFHRFYRHGKLAQISIKQAYGFVQFLESSSCQRALQTEQGAAIRGRKMHLEISKPQRNTKKADHNANNAARRRSRSPDYTRGGSGPQRNDRYSGNQSAMSPRERDNRRFRDDYRPMRSPSPPRGGRGSRRGRSPDRYERGRSYSRSPPRGGRYRSPSPDTDDRLPLPHRAPHEVPDVQVIATKDLPKDYVRWVEDTIRRQGVRIDVLMLSPRLSEAAVIRRQIVEGVLGIVKLDYTTLSKSKANLQLFDRRGGASNVQFNEYADLDPAVIAALVLNAKQTQAQPLQPPPVQYGQSYGLPPAPTPTYSQAPPPAQFPPAPSTNAPGLSNIITSLDPTSLSTLLGAMSQNNANSAAQPSAPGVGPDLARLLGAVSSPSAQTALYAQPAQQPQQAYQNPYQNPALASLLGSLPQAPAPVAAPVQTPAQTTPAGQPDMNEIMAQLAKYQR